MLPPLRRPSLFLILVASTAVWPMFSTLGLLLPSKRLHLNAILGLDENREFSNGRLRAFPHGLRRPKAFTVMRARLASGFAVVVFLASLIVAGVAAKRQVNTRVLPFHRETGYQYDRCDVQSDVCCPCATIAANAVKHRTPTEKGMERTQCQLTQERKVVGKLLRRLTERSSTNSCNHC